MTDTERRPWFVWHEGHVLGYLVAPNREEAKSMAERGELRAKVADEDMPENALRDCQMLTGAEVDERSLDKLQMQEVAEETETQAIYYGAVMGTVHELNKGSNPPFIKIRDLIDQDLIRCEYANSDYLKVVDLVKDRQAIVFVYGTVTVNRITKKIESVRADRFEMAPEFSDVDYHRFFGCAPDLTSGLSSDEFIDRGRDS